MNFPPACTGRISRAQAGGISTLHPRERLIKKGGIPGSSQGGEWPCERAGLVVCQSSSVRRHVSGADGVASSPDSPGSNVPPTRYSAGHPPPLLTGRRICRCGAIRFARAFRKSSSRRKTSSTSSLPSRSRRQSSSQAVVSFRTFHDDTRPQANPNALQASLRDSMSSRIERRSGGWDSLVP